MDALKRRDFLRHTAGLLIGTAVGCSRGPRGGSAAGSSELRIFVYAGSHEQTMREVFVPLFEEASGARVSLFAGWWDGIPKLKTAPADAPPFDLMITDATQGYPAAREGLFAELDLEQVPNHKALAPKSLDHWIFEQRLGLPYPDSVMTLAFWRDPHIEEPRRWRDLLDSRFDGKLGLYNAFYMSLFTFAAMLADANGKPGSAHEFIASELDEVFRFAAEQRSRVKLWWPTSTDMILSLHDQTVSAGNMHSPEYLQAMAENSELGASVPVEDRAMVQVFWAIPAGTKQQPLAEQAIDLLFSDEVQYAFAQRGMATSRPDTAVRVAVEDPRWKRLYPHSDEHFDTLAYYPYDLYAEHWDEIAQRWDRSVLRQG